ncbi:MAG: hypothetical protein K2Y39_09705 [Candidatus Obscuribacterales bacterium]|nr:hypothetical protein [Candidatus Obscuribacterales bacterium]
MAPNFFQEPVGTTTANALFSNWELLYKSTPTIYTAYLYSKASQRPGLSWHEAYELAEKRRLWLRLGLAALVLLIAFLLGGVLNLGGMLALGSASGVFLLGGIATVSVILAFGFAALVILVMVALVMGLCGCFYT